MQLIFRMQVQNECYALRKDRLIGFEMWECAREVNLDFLKTIHATMKLSTIVSVVIPVAVALVPFVNKSMKTKQLFFFVFGCMCYCCTPSLTTFC
eukprot:m.71011 g.71011  ORF g.71011 m.71011 type:complete len:95 (-) comp8331_c1_seq1:419-703(-)